LKLLFDANLSPKLVQRLADIFPGSAHVFGTGMARDTSDATVWQYARDNGFIVVTADSDFIDLARTQGAPPKLIRIENCDFRTEEVEAVLRRHAISIAQMQASANDILVIRRAS